MCHLIRYQSDLPGHPDRKHRMRGVRFPDGCVLSAGRGSGGFAKIG